MTDGSITTVDWCDKHNTTFGNVNNTHNLSDNGQLLPNKTDGKFLSKLSDTYQFPGETLSTFICPKLWHHDRVIRTPDTRNIHWLIAHLQ